MLEQINAFFKAQRNKMIKMFLTKEKLQGMSKLELDQLGDKFDMNLDRRLKKKKLIAQLVEHLEIKK